MWTGEDDHKLEELSNLSLALFCPLHMRTWESLHRRNSKSFLLSVSEMKGGS